MIYDDCYLQQAYDRHSIHNRSEIQASENCGCFACLGSFPAKTVWDWIPGEEDDTGCCPYCNMDTVLGDNTELPVTDESFLRALNAKIFDGPVYWDQTVDPHPITGPGDWKSIDAKTWVLEPGYGKSKDHAQD